MPQALYVVDAFTEQLFSGNPAAVVISDSWYSAETMQQIAIENNLSETAFVVPHSADKYSIRWFSPITEIDFCGHATLAASFIIFEQQPTLNRLTFNTCSVGELTIQRESDGKISMRFPLRKLDNQAEVPDIFHKALPKAPISLLRSVQAWHAIYDHEQDVLDCQPDLALIKTLAPLDLVVSAPGNNVDFVSRYFWPANGGDEDPVTGSIHASLAPYWAKRLGKSELIAHQASKRGGILYCQVFDDYVMVSGHARKYLSGHIHI